MTTLSRETMPERFKVPEQGVEFCFATVDGWAPGHTPKMTAGTRLVEFSPAAELAETMKVITANMEAEAEAAVPRGEAEGGAPVS